MTTIPKSIEVGSGNVSGQVDDGTVHEDGREEEGKATGRGVEVLDDILLDIE